MLTLSQLDLEAKKDDQCLKRRKEVHESKTLVKADNQLYII